MRGASRRGEDKVVGVEGQGAYNAHAGCGDHLGAEVWHASASGIACGTLDRD